MLPSLPLIFTTTPVSFSHPHYLSSRRDYFTPSPPFPSHLTNQQPIPSDRSAHRRCQRHSIPTVTTTSTHSSPLATTTTEPPATSVPHSTPPRCGSIHGEPQRGAAEALAPPLLLSVEASVSTAPPTNPCELLPVEPTSPPRFRRRRTGTPFGVNAYSGSVGCLRDLLGIGWVPPKNRLTTCSISLNRTYQHFWLMSSLPLVAHLIER